MTESPEPTAPILVIGASNRDVKRCALKPLDRGASNYNLVLGGMGGVAHNIAGTLGIDMRTVAQEASSLDLFPRVDGKTDGWKDYRIPIRVFAATY